MSAYIAILRTRFAVLLQYRSAALAGLGTQLFWGLIKVIVLTAFYANASAPAPISLPQAIVFVWLGQALLGLLPWNIDREIEAQVRNGNVAYELARPIDLYWLWFVRGLAQRVIPTIMRCIPLVLIAGLFLRLSAPVSPSAGALFFLSLALSALLAAAITTLVIVSLFWTLSGEGILRLLPHVAMLLSGLAVPLLLFPDWMQPFLSLQPFRGILDIPIRIYTGVIAAADSPAYLLFQGTWTMLLIMAGRLLMQRVLKQIAIQGG